MGVLAAPFPHGAGHKKKQKLAGCFKFSPPRPGGITGPQKEKTIQIPTLPEKEMSKISLFQTKKENFSEEFFSGKGARFSAHKQIFFLFYTSPLGGGRGPRPSFRGSKRGTRSVGRKSKTHSFSFFLFFLKKGLFGGVQVGGG